MKEDIARKLRDHLSKPVVTEVDVVYLLATVRGILEKENPNPKPFALWMYCHWALHHDLTFPGTTTHFLERVDAFVVDTVAGFTSTGTYTMSESHNLFREFIHLDSFRTQLKEFLVSYDLPTDLCDKTDSWKAFVAAYGEVVKDHTLSAVPRSGTGSQLVAVERVIFSGKRGKRRNPASSEPIVQWDVVLKDGRILRNEMQGNPGVGLRLSSAIRLLIPAPATPAP